MGIADVVPGVSGGTIALVMGIYDQLITTITRADKRLLKYVRHRQFANAAAHVNLPFIVSLGSGILTGILFMSAIASSLLEGETSSQFTFAVFFGMIAASAYLVTEMIEAKTRQSKLLTLVFLTLGLLGAITINQFVTPAARVEQPAAATGPAITPLSTSRPQQSAAPGNPSEQVPVGNPAGSDPPTPLSENSREGIPLAPPSHLYIFICAAIAICAMILPGISGSMILIILGVFDHILNLPRNLLEAGERTSAIIELGIFACGALVGLMLFSRILKWLLMHYRNQLLATLTGIMLGALPVLFSEAFKRKALEDTTAIGQLGLIGTAFVAALIMVLITRKTAALTKNESTQEKRAALD